MDRLIELLKQSKFWALLVGLVMLVVRHYVPDFPLEDDQVLAIVILLASWIIGQNIEAWRKP